MAVQTGVAQFGEVGRYGVLTKQDSSRLLRWGLEGAAQLGHGVQYRMLVHRMLPMIADEDKLMLASAADAAGEEWKPFAAELRTAAGF